MTAMQPRVSLRSVACFLGLMALVAGCPALGQTPYVEFTASPGCFAIARGNKASHIVVDSQDWPGVTRAATNLQRDVQRVTGTEPTLTNSPSDAVIIVGTIGKSAIVDRLIREHKINVAGVKGKWESTLTQVVNNPIPGVAKALVIAGSDKRGTIYGIYDLSEQIGVSPWYWWADVPVRHRDALFVKPGRFVQGEPAVKYRGIFLNDEAPDLSNWVYKNFTNYYHPFYEHVFELLLRLKANYLWPAMWNNCFSQDDPLNPKLADEYGIVMGTSHVEPMMRADKEWNKAGFTPEQWNFDKSPEELTRFWTEGVERNKPYENIITVAMRGKIDTPMSETANISLLEKIVAAQRKIIAGHVNPDVTKVPQLWCLYKEVQEYYEKGMRVPDDVTLLWADDNWGDIRRLPTPDERKRSGGAGVYYHFDYVGGPRNYKWINTNPLPKIWEQMNQAYQRGADRIWIVNVGGLKPKEFPMEFFLNLAWNPKRWSKDSLGEYTRLWAAREFGPEHASEIAEIVSKYTKYNGRRKPELLDPTTFSITNYREADTVQREWEELTAKAENLYKALPPAAREAFFELALFPTKAACIVNKLYIAAAKNRLFAQQGRSSANDYAAQVRTLFKADADWAAQYEHGLQNGKWDHFMDQTHIGYTNWQEPPQNNMPVVKEIEVPKAASMGVAIEGSASAWPGASEEAQLADFDVYRRQKPFIDVFNRGKSPFPVSLKPSASWIVVNPALGTVGKEERIWVGIDWAKAPKGVANGSIEIRQGDGLTVNVKVHALNPIEPTREALRGFVEGDGYVSMEAEHYTRKVDTASAHWDRIPDYGRTLSGVTVFPVTAPTQNAGLLSQSTNRKPQATPPLVLEYRMLLFHGGPVTVDAIFGPTQPFVPGHGFRYAISFDSEPPKVIDIHANYVYMQQSWEKSVADAVRVTTSKHTLSGPGYHTLKFWAIDAPLVLEKLVLNTGGLKPSYLGPPESYRPQSP